MPTFSVRAYQYAQTAVLSHPFSTMELPQIDMAVLRGTKADRDRQTYFGDRLIWSATVKELRLRYPREEVFVYKVIADVVTSNRTLEHMLSASARADILKIDIYGRGKKPVAVLKQMAAASNDMSEVDHTEWFDLHFIPVLEVAMRAMKEFITKERAAKQATNTRQKSYTQ
ncbi:hypothetical protein PLICRDRAFT_581533 [Plicaturopsis crispa FD-325 SS-3]|nr:hypothetical protein PLICRDRAFT_581533 [Plicaturopsis crispa FD-325 SS-3]